MIKRWCWFTVKTETIYPTSTFLDKHMHIKCHNPGFMVNVGLLYKPGKHVRLFYTSYLGLWTYQIAFSLLQHLGFFWWLYKRGSPEST